MIGVVIVAHGGLAREYLSTVEHVMGRQRAMCAISITDDDDRRAKEAEICAAAKSVDGGDGVIIVTDVFGGSPHNLCKVAGHAPKRKILYGANIPMLIKLTQIRRRYCLENAAKAALDAGRNYINMTESGEGA